MTDFSDFLGALEEDAFDENPVSIEEFVTSKDFLQLPPLSEYQYQMIKASTQIYKKETLLKFQPNHVFPFLLHVKTHIQ